MIWSPRSSPSTGWRASPTARPWRGSAAIQIERHRMRISGLLLIIMALSGSITFAQTKSDTKDVQPLRVGVVGLVHDHIHGFFRQFLHRTDMEIVGIAEPDQDLARRTAATYPIKDVPIFRSLDEMLDKAHPQAVVTYTSTF